MAEKKKIVYEIIAHMGTLGEPIKGWAKEVNIMTWGKNSKPVIDIRKFNREDEVLGKGISLSLDEYKNLISIDPKKIEEFLK